MSGIKYIYFEDELIMEAVAKNGGVLDAEVLLTVKRQLPDRTESSIKSRWYSYLKNEYMEQEKAKKEEVVETKKPSFFKRLFSWFRKKKETKE